MMGIGKYKKNVGCKKYSVAIFIISIFIVVALGIGFFIYLSSSEKSERIAIKVSQQHEYVQELGEIEQIESTVREVTKKEKEDYPVIYGGTGDGVVVVNHNVGDRSVLCVVDNDEVKRCFNNINIG